MSETIEHNLRENTFNLIFLPHPLSQGNEQHRPLLIKRKVVEDSFSPSSLQPNQQFFNGQQFHVQTG